MVRILHLRADGVPRAFSSWHALRHLPCLPPGRFDPAPPKFKSLREALLAACTADPQPVKDVIKRALELHPLKGKTPAATASSELLRMQRAGLVSKPERGMVMLFAEKPAPKTRRRSK